MKKTVKELDLKGKRVLLRVDFNVPFDGKRILDDTRIRAELENLNLLLSGGASVIIVSHRGRPDGERNEKYSLKPVFEYLKTIYSEKVKFIDDFRLQSGKKAAKLKMGEIALLENIRFYKEEEENDREFSKELASLADIYVNDAFGTAHRKHASTYGVAEFLKNNAIGLLIEKEFRMIEEKIANPKRPFVVILGGSKIRDKIKIIKNLIDKVDVLLIGGGLSYTFLFAEGKKVGNSILDEGSVEFAKETLKLAREKGKKVVLPLDNVCAKSIDGDVKITKGADISDGYIGLDIGPKTVAAFVNEIKKAGLIVWNGPLGMYEKESFMKGTEAVAKAVATSKGESVIGGGDVGSAITALKLENKITHLSTGGGASLKLLEGSGLEALEVIREGKR